MIEPLRAKEISNLLNRDTDLRIIRDHQLVLRYREYFKEGGSTVALVGGVYDMLHDGHMIYLLEALKSADILIIALDDDALTRKRKNDPRKPFDSELDRARVLCLACLGHIITFRGVDEHPFDLIELLHPDVLITSKTTTDVTDDDRKKLESYCGKVLALEAQSSTHTTAKFKRFAEMHGLDTAEKLITAMNDIFGLFDISFEIKRNGGDSHA
jgi:D-beta-D-heptose 7-phosphate kinase/D-beta-D-heptose 1-phosphate adenosyltransferase